MYSWKHETARLNRYLYDFFVECGTIDNNIVYIHEYSMKKHNIA